MPDPRFFDRADPLSLGELAERTGAELSADADPKKLIYDIGSLDDADGDTIVFLENRRYVAALQSSSAGACLIARAFVDRAPAGMALLVTDRPRRAFARIAQTFYPDPPHVPGVHESAVVDPTAQVAQDCRIGPNAVIGAGAELRAGVRVESGAVVGPNVVLGGGTVVGAGASLTHCVVGERVVIYPGARIGQPGFGFEGDASGPIKMPQLGRVIIEDDVEVGANTTIDRGSGPDTIVGRGTMIDNLVQIGHNVIIGKGCVIVSQVGIAGSTRLGNFVVVGGQVGIAGHIEIGDRVQIAACAAVNRGIPEGSIVGGYPAVPIREFRRQIAAMKALGRRDGGKQDGASEE